jgi:hypothetical protein
MSKHGCVVLCALLLCALGIPSTAAFAKTRPVAAKIAAPVRSVVRVANPSEHRHLDSLEPRLTVAPNLELKKVTKVLNSPEIELGLDPVEGDAFVYHPVAGTTSDAPPTAQVSLLLAIKNKETAKIVLEQVRFS